MANEDLAADREPVAPVREETRFSRPLRYVVRALLFIALIGFLGFILQAGLVTAFMTNPGLNGLIIGSLFVGVLIALRELWRIHAEARAMTRLAAAPTQAQIRRGQVIAPLGPVLSALETHSLAPSQAASVLESIAVRLDDGREVLRYLGGLLVFLGLLGTFWGLILVVGSVAETIRSLPSGGEGAIAFDRLRAGLEGPLSGMGTAFSSSLFGLAGSLILGFLDLNAGQAQNRFYNALEEWISTVTRLGGAGPSAVLESGEASAPAYVTALLEQTAENLENLERTLVRLEERRSAGGDGSAEVAAAMRGIESAMRGLVQEQAAGRDAFVQELRQEVKLLGRTLAAMGDRQKA